MNAEIICVGTEILLGDIVNTNATYLSQQLAKLGIDCYGQVVVGDNKDRLKKTVSDSIYRSDIVIITGGLGPTYDDQTKQTVADYYHKEMVLDEGTWNKLNILFKDKDHAVIQNNIQQAMIPEGSKALENHAGVAPGLLLEEDGKIVIMLPGPPREMKRIFQDHIIPFLQTKTNSIIHSHTIHLFGIGESQVASELKDMMITNSNPTIATYAKEGEMYIRVSAKAKNQKTADEMCQPLINSLLHQYQEYVYGIDTPSLAYTLYTKLIDKKQPVHIVENVTGGYILNQLTQFGGGISLFSGNTDPDLHSITPNNSNEVITLYVLGNTISDIPYINRTFEITLLYKDQVITETLDVGFGYENSYARLCHVASLPAFKLLLNTI